VIVPASAAAAIERVILLEMLIICSPCFNKFDQIFKFGQNRMPALILLLLKINRLNAPAVVLSGSVATPLRLDKGETASG
jgi:hypothetical protein